MFTSRKLLLLLRITQLCERADLLAVHIGAAYEQSVQTFFDRVRIVVKSPTP